MHPSVPAVYLAGTVGITLCASQPVYQVISLAAAVALSVVLRGALPTLRGLRWQLPMLLLICLANPFFSASGSTELFRVASRAIYLEGLAYGFTSGAMMVSTVLWLECATVMLDEEGVRALGARSLPVVALMVSMSAQLVPQLLRRAQGARRAASACTAARATKTTVRARGTRLTTMLMSWAMEDSLERADAMRARGWGAATRRTSYQGHPFGAADVVRLLVLVFLSALNVALAWAACGQWRFYPTMTRLVAWWGYAPFVLLALLPTVLVLIDRLRWRLLA